MILHARAVFAPSCHPHSEILATTHRMETVGSDFESGYETTDSNYIFPVEIGLSDIYTMEVEPGAEENLIKTTDRQNARNHEAGLESYNPYEGNPLQTKNGWKNSPETCNVKQR